MSVLRLTIGGCQLNVLTVELELGVVRGLVVRAGRARSAGSTERFQRWRSGVRTAAAMTVMRLGLQRALRKTRQDFSLATRRSTGTRAADRARLIVRWVAVGSWFGRRLTGVVTQESAPM